MNAKKLGTIALVVAAVAIILGLVVSRLGGSYKPDAQVDTSAVTQPLELGDSTPEATQAAADSTDADAPKVDPQGDPKPAPHDGPKDLSDPQDPKPDPQDGPKDITNPTPKPDPKPNVNGPKDIEAPQDDKPDPTPKPNKGPQDIGI